MAILDATDPRPERPAFAVPEEVFRPMPEVVLYLLPGFQGSEKRTNLSFAHIGSGFIDVGSLVVVSGTWEFYDNENYQGNRIELRPGYYPNFRQRVISFQPVAL